MKHLDLYGDSHNPVEPVKKVKVIKNPIELGIPEIDLPGIYDKPKKDRDTTEDILAGVSCGLPQIFKGPFENDYFKKENLFSELVSDYQRIVARYNLGIAEEYALKWGNIKGTLTDQTDLVDYMKKPLDDHIKRHLEKINEEIARAIRNKANILDPKFEGSPTVPTPDTDDNSRRIANTEWVKMAIGDSNSAYLNKLSLSKNYMYHDDPPQTITLNWSFYGNEENKNDVEEVYINGVSVGVEETKYVFTNVTDDFIVHFYYKVHGKGYNKYLPFRKVPAIYYGTTSKKGSMIKTAESNMIVDSGKEFFVYLYIPQDSDARIAVDNIYGGFEKIAAGEENDNDGNAEDGTIQYYLYKTVNSGLGLLHIHYDKQQTN